MVDAHGYSLMMSTTDSPAEADALAQALIHQRLAGCVQLSPIVSHYLWQGEPTTSNEVLILIKTTAANVERVISYVEANHSYDVAEVIEVPISTGSRAYLAWLDQAVAFSDKPEEP